MRHIVFSPEVGFIEFRSVNRDRSWDFEYIRSLRLEEVYVFKLADFGRHIDVDTDWGTDVEGIFNDFEYLTSMAYEYFLFNLDILDHGYKHWETFSNFGQKLRTYEEEE